MKTGRLDEILQMGASRVEVLVAGGQPFDRERLPPEVVSVSILGERWRVELEESALFTVLDYVQAQRARLLSVQPVRQSLEDYFFEELQQDARETGSA